MSFHIDDLCNLTDAYLEPDQVRDIHRAYEFGAEAHQAVFVVRPRES